MSATRHYLWGQQVFFAALLKDISFELIHRLEILNLDYVVIGQLSC